VIGAALLAGLVLGVSFTVGWRTLLAPWAELSPGELVGLLILSLASYVLRAVRVYDYFLPRFEGRFLTVLRLSVLHNVANNLLPMRAGEMVFPWLMGRYFGQGFASSLASLVWIRLLDLHFLGVIGLLILYLWRPWPIWLLCALAWVASLTLMSSVGRLAPIEQPGRLGRLRNILTASPPSSTFRVARLYLWTVVSWSTKFVAFAVVLRHFLPIDLWQVLIGVMGAELSSVLPFHGIAGSGSYELAAVAALLPLGVSPDAALVGAVNLHLFLLGVTLLLGLLALLLPIAPKPGFPEAVR
jgi:uncharacterized membrane protein YbhN (UPF0104 family)